MAVDDPTLVLKAELARIEAHLLTIPDDCEVAGIYLKMRQDLAAILDYSAKAENRKSATS